jgi:hypothetical protein
MYRRVTTGLLVLLALSACGSPDDLATLAQPGPDAVAECKEPISYPGPGTPMPTSAPNMLPTATPIVDPRDIPEQAAPLGLGSAARIKDERAALGAFMVMPAAIRGHQLETAWLGPRMMEENGMLLAYGQRTVRDYPASLPWVELFAGRYSLTEMSDGSPFPPRWSSIYRDGAILWTEDYHEENYRDAQGEGVCRPILFFAWMIEGSDVLYTISTDSVERRDLVLSAYLEALKNAPQIRDLAPLPTFAPEPSFDPSWTPTATTTPTPNVLPPEPTQAPSAPYPAPRTPTP